MARRNIQGESPQWVDRAEAEHHPKQPHRTRIQWHLACHITGAYITCQGRAFRRGPDLLTAPMSEHSKRFTSLFPFPCHLNGMGWYGFGLGCGLGCQRLDSRCIFVCVWAFVKYYIDILDFACTNIYVHIFFGDRTPEEWRLLRLCDSCGFRIRTNTLHFFLWRNKSWNIFKTGPILLHIFYRPIILLKSYICNNLI